MIKVLAFMGYLIMVLLGIIFIMVLVAIIVGLVMHFVEWIEEERDAKNNREKNN